MRIFASWSGTPAKDVAELLRAWIPSVVQDAEVYVSSQDIGKGARWQTSVTDNLAGIDFGIIVVTPSNIVAPWIMFEAGALSKTVNGVVIPLLCGVEALEAATSPLSQFQWAKPQKEDIRDVMSRINAASTKPLEIDRFSAAFEKWWPEFESGYAGIELEPKETKRTNTEKVSAVEDAVAVLLDNMQRLSRKVDIVTDVISRGNGVFPVPKSLRVRALTSDEKVVLKRFSDPPSQDQIHPDVKSSNVSDGRWVKHPAQDE